MKKPQSDHEAITIILTGLQAKGCKLHTVYYGDDPVAVDTLDQAIEEATCADAASVYITLPDGNETFVYFVLGNDPEEVACDYGVSLSPFIDPIVYPWWGL